MSKARVLVDMFLIHPIWMKCVNTMLASIVDLNLRPPSWLWWIKLLDIIWNWSLSPITFSINFHNMLKSIMGLKDLGMSYDILLGFGIITVIEFLKWLDQYPNSKHVFAIVTIFFKQSLSLMICLRWLYDSLLGLEADILLHLTIVLVNSSSGNDAHNNKAYDPSLFRTFSSI